MAKAADDRPDEVHGHPSIGLYVPAGSCSALYDAVSLHRFQPGAEIQAQCTHQRSGVHLYVYQLRAVRRQRHPAGPQPAQQLSVHC